MLIEIYLLNYEQLKFALNKARYINISLLNRKDLFSSCFIFRKLKLFII